ncbi:hypothetical protein [Cochleicola gelatinilyticus]|uniref:Beta-lactamase-inhibitor-like PepSY-like domain-containing protein n=1 Tax=Cochleicola gelatinilyticus TaxID=1763537 RepID=A0A167ITD7_9FLAO|nr:hypothetical protein [Cochleicola gelatinilyticus]OAB79998.1 hypothetical protein ULVI_04470 [Cochleicola gelatinilyticus]
MKKLMLTAVFAFGTLTAVNAQDAKEVKEVQKEPTAMNQTPVKAEKPATLKAEVKTEAEVVQDYKEVAVADVPQTVTDAVAKQFAGSKVTKAWLNEKGEYKLEVTAEGKKAQTLYANSKGEWIKKNM